METSFIVPNKSRDFSSLLLPLVAVANHIVQLLHPCFDTMLSTVPLAAHFLHYRQKESHAVIMLSFLFHMIASLTSLLQTFFSDGCPNINI